MGLKMFYQRTSCHWRSLLTSAMKMMVNCQWSALKSVLNVSDDEGSWEDMEEETEIGGDEQNETMTTVC